LAHLDPMRRAAPAALADLAGRAEIFDVTPGAAHKRI
jgi:hypothetical protein